MGGLPGTGKTTIAAALADDLEYVVIRSDRIRKEIAGLDPNHHGAAPPGLYSAAMTERTYRLMLARADQLLQRGESVLLDATWQSARPEPALVTSLPAPAPGSGELRCTAPQTVADSRIEERIVATDDASDATVAVAHDLAATFEPWPEATVIDTSGGAVGQLRLSIGRRGGAGPRRRGDHWPTRQDLRP